MIPGILLAAGRSERYGRHKLLEKDAEGIPLAQRAIAPYGLLDQVVAVIPEGHAALRTLFEAVSAAVVEAPSGAQLADSLRAGIMSTLWADGWIVGLADMPAVTAATVSALHRALREGAIMVACRYQGRRGNPVGFSRGMLADLLALKGDQGARRLLAQQAGKVQWLDVDDPGILLDIDVPSDWNRVIKPEASKP